MKRLLQSLVVLGFLAWLGYLYIQGDRLDDLAENAAKFRTAMSGSYQFQAQGAMLTQSHDSECWLIFENIHPDVAWYRQEDQAFLHTQITSLKELLIHWDKKPGSEMMMTYAQMPKSKKGMKVKMDHLVDHDIQKKKMIWAVKPISSDIKSCPRHVLHEVMALGF